MTTQILLLHQCFILTNTMDVLLAILIPPPDDDDNNNDTNNSNPENKQNLDGEMIKEAMDLLETSQLPRLFEIIQDSGIRGKVFYKQRNDVVNVNFSLENCNSNNNKSKYFVKLLLTFLLGRTEGFAFILFLSKSVLIRHTRKQYIYIL